MSLPSFHSGRSFSENADSLATIDHFMILFKSAVGRITPSLIPAIAVNQPLMPLAEHTHWTLGEMYDKDQYFIMLGVLHIKMAALKMLGLVY